MNPLETDINVGRHHVLSAISADELRTLLANVGSRRSAVQLLSRNTSRDMDSWGSRAA